VVVSPGTSVGTIEVMALLVALFVAVPLVEIAVIIKVGESLGVANTIALLLLISILGAWLVKRQGVGLVRRVQVELAAGRIPGSALVDGALLLVAGTMLLLPGFVTDAVGLLLLLPPVRAGVRRWLRRRWMRGQGRWVVRRTDGPPPY
jgi:UPF0716 protein FxsA